MALTANYAAAERALAVVGKHGVSYKRGFAVINLEFHGKIEQAIERLLGQYRALASQHTVAPPFKCQRIGIDGAENSLSAARPWSLQKTARIGRCKLSDSLERMKFYGCWCQLIADGLVDSIVNDDARATV